MHATTASRSRMPTRPTPAGPASRATRAPASRTPISALGLPCGRVRARAPQRRLEAETTLGATPSPLLALLDKARAREQAAETSCVDGDPALAKSSASVLPTREMPARCRVSLDRTRPLRQLPTP